MTDQDDLFGKDTEVSEEQANNDSDESAVSESEEATVAVEESVEEPGSEPLSAENDADIAGSGVATGEVRAVDPPVKKGSSPLLLGVLLLLVLFGGGYYLMSSSMNTSNSQIAENQVKATPKRYAIDKKVEVEVVDQQQVAKVETVAAAVELKPEVQVAKAEKPAPEKQEQQPQVAKTKAVEQKVEKKAVPEIKDLPEFQILVGPYLSKSSATKVKQQLSDLGYDSVLTKGRGQVAMIRLLEGVYQKAEVIERLKTVRGVVKDAFKMPAGDKWAIYVGSFSDNERAEKYALQLAGKGVQVTPVPSEVEMNGRMLLITTTDEGSVKQTIEKISTAGLSVRQASK